MVWNKAEGRNSDGGTLFMETFSRVAKLSGVQLQGSCVFIIFTASLEHEIRATITEIASALQHPTHWMSFVFFNPRLWGCPPHTGARHVTWVLIICFYGTNSYNSQLQAAVWQLLFSRLKLCMLQVTSPEQTEQRITDGSQKEFPSVTKVVELLAVRPVKQYKSLIFGWAVWKKYFLLDLFRSGSVVNNVKGKNDLWTACKWQNFVLEINVIDSNYCPTM